MAKGLIPESAAERAVVFAEPLTPAQFATAGARSL